MGFWACALVALQLSCAELTGRLPGGAGELAGKVPTAVPGAGDLKARLPGSVGGALRGGVPTALGGALPAGAAALIQKGDLRQLAIQLGAAAAAVVVRELIFAVADATVRWRHDKERREQSKRIAAATLDCRETEVGAAPGPSADDAEDAVSTVITGVAKALGEARGSFLRGEEGAAVRKIDAVLGGLPGSGLDRAQLLSRGRLRDARVRMRLDAEPAAVLLKEALAGLDDVRRAAGKDDAEVAHHLSTIAHLSLRMLNFAEADRRFGEALRLRERWLPKNHLCLAQSHQDLAALHRQQYGATSFQTAERHFQQALAIKQRALGKAHPDTASVLVALADLYRDRGRFPEAEHALQRATAIYRAAIAEHKLSEFHPGVSAAYLRWGQVRQALADYDRALSLYQLALRLRIDHARARQADPDSERDVQEAQAAQASLYQRMGDRDGAISLYQGALAHQEARLAAPSLASAPTEIIRLAELRSALAEALMARGQQGDADQARHHLGAALAARERAFGKDHPEVGRSLVAMGRFLFQYHQPVEAAQHLADGLRILQQALDPHHPEVAAAQLQLGVLRHDQGDLDSAQRLYQAVLQSREARLGDDHPDTALVSSLLASTWLAEREREPQAVTALAEAFARSERALGLIGATTEEGRVRAFLENQRLQEDIIYSLASQQKASPAAQDLAVRALLLRKGRALDEVAQTGRTLHAEVAAGNPGAQESLRKLQESRQGQAALAFSSNPALDPKAMQSLQRELQLQAEQAHKGLPKLKERALPPPSRVLEEVKANLASDEVLVEMIAFQRFRLAPEPGQPRLAERRYLAAVLTRSGSPKVVDLGPADPIEQAADDYLKLIAEAERSQERSATRAPLQAALARLGALVIDPLRASLGKHQALLLSPDAKLHLVPLHAVGQRAPLIAERPVSYLTSGRDLLRRGIPQDLSSNVLVLAGPDYDHDVKGDLPCEGESPRPARARPAQPLAEARGGPLGIHFKGLSNAAAEGNVVQEHLPQATVCRGQSATRERLLSARQPGILHVATHGVFLHAGQLIHAAPGPAGESRAAHITAGPAGAPDLQGAAAGRRAPSDPLLRSFLALAGANRGQGTVTALEVAGMDLWGTQLVVFSACESGVGDVERPGQGVYGLRRAVMIAGAQSLLTTLWKVNDRATVLLMNSLYDNLLQQKSRGEALRQALLKLRTLKGKDLSGRPFDYSHPLYWAPFILIGDSRPLAHIEPESPQ